MYMFQAMFKLKYIGYEKIMILIFNWWIILVIGLKSIYF